MILSGWNGGRVAAALVAGVLLLAAETAEAAGGVAGKATFAKGDVQRGATVAGPFSPLKRGDRVREGDVIKTGNDSRVEVTFSDGSRLRLTPNATMQLGAPRPARPGLPGEVTLSGGSIWAQISKATGGEAKFNIRTTNAVAGVRGTTLSVVTTSDGATWILVFEGSVGATNAIGAGERLLSRTYGVQISPDGTVHDPVPIADSYPMTVMQEFPKWVKENLELDATAPEPVGAESATGEAAAPGANEAGGGLRGREDINKMTPDDMLSNANKLLETMRGSVSSTVQLVSEARKKNDVVKLNCLNERLALMKGVLKVAEDAKDALVDFAAAGDKDSARSAYTKIALASERVATLRVQAQNCVGAESYYGGDTEATTDINEELAGADTWFGDRGPFDSPADDFADGPGDTGDNTSSETPPPPPPASIFQP